MSPLAGAAAAGTCAQADVVRAQPAPLSHSATASGSPPAAAALPAALPAPAAASAAPRAAPLAAPQRRQAANRQPARPAPPSGQPALVFQQRQRQQQLGWQGGPGGVPGRPAGCGPAIPAFRRASTQHLHSGVQALSTAGDLPGSGSRTGGLSRSSPAHTRLQRQPSVQLMHSAAGGFFWLGCFCCCCCWSAGSAPASWCSCTAKGTTIRLHAAGKSCRVSLAAKAFAHADAFASPSARRQHSRPQLQQLALHTRRPTCTSPARTGADSRHCWACASR